MDQLKMEVMQVRYNDYVKQVGALKMQAKNSIEMAKKKYTDDKARLEQQYLDELHDLIYDTLYKSLSMKYFEQMYLGFKVVKTSGFMSKHLRFAIEEKNMSTASKKGAKKINYDRIKTNFFNNLREKTETEIQKLTIDDTWKEKYKQAFGEVINEIRTTFVNKYKKIFEYSSVLGGATRRKRRVNKSKTKSKSKNKKRSKRKYKLT